VPLLLPAQVDDLHRLLNEVCTKAIAVNADAGMFPDDWLFRWRWDKGKKKTKKSKAGAKGKKLELDAEELEEVLETTEQNPKGLKFLALVCISLKLRVRVHYD
jgi:formamidopyrimidine-DNA glycosylase